MARFGLLASASLALVCAGAAQAQTSSGRSAPPAEGKQSYDQAYFAPYRVQNAEDMLRRVPGVAAIVDAASPTTQTRGFGSGGDQILLGGKRMAAKGQILQTLRRIPAANVERIELIRGTSADIDVQSEGVVVNIVLKSGARAAGAGSYEVNYRFDDRGFSTVDGLLSYSNSLGRLSYVLGVETNDWSIPGTTPAGGFGDYSRRFRDEVYYYPSGGPQELRPQHWSRRHKKKIFTANLVYDFASGDQFRFNALFQPLPIREIDRTDYTTLSAAGAVTGAGLEYHQRNLHNEQLALGSELQKRLGPGSLTVLGLFTRATTETSDFRTRTPRGGLLTEVSRSGLDQRTVEGIFRSSYAAPIARGQQLTVGGEIAQNTLTQDLGFFFDRDRDGRLEPIAIPTSHARVREVRGEAFAVHDWQITPQLSLESTLSVEASTITTNYPAIPKHSYRFLKPRLDLRYTPTPRDRWRVKAERTVSQLDFNNFVPTYNVAIDRIDFGNPEIQPQKTWVYEVGFEHRLAGDGGTLEGRVFYQDIRDLIDRGPLGPSVAGLPQSAPINIDHARLYGVELKASVRLTALGLPNAQVNTRLLRQFSRVEDPFTQLDRKLKDPWNREFSFGFRHDLTALGASYGVNYLDTGGPQVTSDIRNFDDYRRGPRVDAFFEKALPNRFSVRVEAYNLTRSHEFLNRALYRVSQADGALVRLQSFEEVRDRRFAIRLRGKF